MLGHCVDIVGLGVLRKLAQGNLDQGEKPAELEATCSPLQTKVQT